MGKGIGYMHACTINEWCSTELILPSMLSNPVKCIHAAKMFATVSESWNSLNVLKFLVGPFFALEFSVRVISANDVRFSLADSSLRKILLLTLIRKQLNNTWWIYKIMYICCITLCTARSLGINNLAKEQNEPAQQVFWIGHLRYSIRWTTAYSVHQKVPTGNFIFTLHLAKSSILDPFPYN